VTRYIEETVSEQKQGEMSGNIRKEKNVVLLRHLCQRYFPFLIYKQGIITQESTDSTISTDKINRNFLIFD